MSNHDASLSPEPSDRKVLISALGWLGVLGVFALIVAITYLPKRGTPVSQIDVDARFKIRDTVRAEQKRLVGAYEWVNQAEGVVRIPVERAMDLVLRDLRAEQAEAANR